jgi:methylglutaconyl-CoA hydratase
MPESLVVRETHGPVALLVLNRPDRRNALSRALVAELGDALTSLASDPSVRSVVLTGADPTFCAGMDLKEAEAAGHGDEAEKRAVADVRGIADLIQQLHDLPKPTVAALNGDAYAAGAGLATACDFVLAAEGARIGYPEVRRGLVAAVVLHDLVRQVGDRRARALLLSGEPIDAAEAERWGLVNWVVAPEQCRAEALGVARKLMDTGPRAVATLKRLIDESSGRPADLRGAAAVSAAVRVSDEAMEGMRAFLEKRPPSWAVEPTPAPPLAPSAGSPADRPPGGSGALPMP